ncbi:hypothetical protein ACWC4J_06760 [Streptomyces sp. NPDC001356]
MPQLTPEEAADLLGIPDEDVEVFLRLVDALRTPKPRHDEASAPQQTAPRKTRQERTDEAVTAFVEGSIDEAAFRELLDKIEEHPE